MNWLYLAAIPESYATAWGCLHENMHIKNGDTVFIRDGTSALALAAINIASNIDGVTVHSSTRDAANENILISAGSKIFFIERDELMENNKACGKIVITL